MKRYLFLFLLIALFPNAARAATLTFGGASNTTVGATFSVPVLLNTEGGETANTISGSVVYPSQLLTLVSVSKGGSIITLWPSEPTQSSGAVHFEGVILNPGWSGAGGTVVTLTFQAKGIGTATLSFSDASVLANDGNATPILSNTSRASIVIGAQAPQPVKTIPPPHTTNLPVPANNASSSIAATTTVTTPVAGTPSQLTTISENTQETIPEQISVSYSTLVTALALLAIVLSVAWYIFGWLGYVIVKRGGDAL